MEKTEYELARQAQEDASGLASLAIDEDVILSTAVRSNVDLGAVEEHDVLRFRLTGVELSGFQLDGGRQTLSGDTLTVRREDWDAVEPGFSLPYKLMDFRETLESEPLIQSDDPRIQDEARRAVGRWLRDPKRAAGILTRHVDGMLAKSVTFRVLCRFSSRGRATATNTPSCTWPWPGRLGFPLAPRSASSTSTGPFSITRGPRCGWASGWRSIPRSASTRRTPHISDSWSADWLSRSRSSV